MEKSHKAVWRNSFVGSGHKRIDPKTAELKAMTKKIKELETANDILKRALGATIPDIIEPHFR